MKTLVVLALLAGLAGCADDGPDDTDGSEPTVTSSESSYPSDTAAAVQDLADRHEVDPAEITVVSREEVTWRNGSRGCAEPGMAYTQALIDGSRIILRLDGRDYEYHSGGSHPVFLCERPTE